MRVAESESSRPDLLVKYLNLIALQLAEPSYLKRACVTVKNITRKLRSSFPLHTSDCGYFPANVLGVYMARNTGWNPMSNQF